MQIREEQAADCSEIYQLTEAAFAPMNFSDGTEQDVINRLRALGALSLSLVAELEFEIVGHIAFSPAAIGQVQSGWFCLGPVSVQPRRQRLGIGSALIKRGLENLEARGATGCVLVGDPAYYSRFGFRSDGNVYSDGFPPEHVQWVSFGREYPSGELVFSSAFHDEA